MNIRQSLFHVTAGRGESSTRAVGSIRLGAIALLGVAALAVATVQSCRAARNTDGSVTITFAPDMTITAWGLEDALEQLQDLYGRCLSGTWQRLCTPEEMAGIERMQAKVVEAKKKLNHD